MKCGGYWRKFSLQVNIILIWLAFDRSLSLASIYHFSSCMYACWPAVCVYLGPRVAVEFHVDRAPGQCGQWSDLGNQDTGQCGQWLDQALSDYGRICRLTACHGHGIMSSYHEASKCPKNLLWWSHNEIRPKSAQFSVHQSVCTSEQYRLLHTDILRSQINLTRQCQYFNHIINWLCTIWKTSLNTDIHDMICAGCCLWW